MQYRMPIHLIPVSIHGNIAVSVLLELNQIGSLTTPYHLITKSDMFEFINNSSEYLWSDFCKPCIVLILFV